MDKHYRRYAKSLAYVCLALISVGWTPSDKSFKTNDFIVGPTSSDGIGVNTNKFLVKTNGVTSGQTLINPSFPGQISFPGSLFTQENGTGIPLAFDEGNVGNYRIRGIDSLKLLMFGIPPSATNGYIWTKPGNNLQDMGLKNGTLTVSSNVTAPFFQGSAADMTLPVPQQIIASQCLLPPLAVTTWWEYGDKATQTDFTNLIQQIKTNGMYAAGFNIVWLDDGVYTNRINGHLVWDTNKFPNGLPWLCAYSRSNGIIPGIYTAFGNLTCALYPATPQEYVITDVADFASQGFGALKVDSCNVGQYPNYFRRLSTSFANAIMNLPFVSGYDGTNNGPMIFHQTVQRSFPNGLDLTYSMYDWFVFGQANCLEDANMEAANTIQNVLTNAFMGFKHRHLLGPGSYYETGWQSPDGYFWFTNAVNSNPALLWPTNVSQAAVTMGAIMSSPLIIAHITSSNLYCFTNREVIRINQDPGCIPGRWVLTNGLSQIWSKPLLQRGVRSDVGLSNAVAVVNASANNSNIVVNWHVLGLPTNAVYQVRNLWTQTDLGLFTNSFTVPVLSSNIGLYLIQP